MLQAARHPEIVEREEGVAAKSRRVLSKMMKDEHGANQTGLYLRGGSLLTVLIDA